MTKRGKLQQKHHCSKQKEKQLQHCSEIIQKRQTKQNRKTEKYSLLNPESLKFPHKVARKKFSNKISTNFQQKVLTTKFTKSTLVLK